nr:3-ketoacyl-CoA synthase 12-like [Ipomoea batatas]
MEECFFDTLEKLSVKSEVSPEEIDVLVVNVSMLLSAPSLCSRIMWRFAMREDVRAFNLSGMGCSASLLSIKLVENMFRCRWNMFAIVVTSKFIASFWYSRNDKSMMLANCLFQSGAIANNLHIGIYRIPKHFEGIGGGVSFTLRAYEPAATGEMAGEEHGGKNFRHHSASAEDHRCGIGNYGHLPLLVGGDAHLHKAHEGAADGVQTPDHRSSVDHNRVILCSVGQKRRSKVCQGGSHQSSVAGGGPRTQQPHQIISGSATVILYIHHRRDGHQHGCPHAEVVPLEESPRFCLLFGIGLVKLVGTTCEEKEQS